MSVRWLDTLSTDTRKRVLAAMRAIQVRSDSARIHPFLGAILKGMTPDDAARAAQTARVRAICASNASRADHQAHRSVESESGLVASAREDILRAIVEADASHASAA